MTKTKIIRFFLSYNLLKRDFIAFKMNIMSIRELIVDEDFVNDDFCKRESVIFMTPRYPSYDKMGEKNYQ